VIRAVSGRICGAGLLLLVALLPSVSPGAEPTMEQRLQRLERRVSHISDLVLEVEGLKRTNRELLGRIEGLEHRLRQLERKQRELYLDLDQRISSLQGGAPAPAGPVVETPAAGAGQDSGAAKSAAAATASVDARKMRKEYDSAYALLQPSRRDYKKAIAAFRKFLEKYPQGDLTDNALYWLGETYYVTQDNASALASFDELLQRFPGSEKVPGALLKKGYVLQAMGRKAEAKKMFERLVAEYPDASVSRMARTRLKQLK